MYLVLWLDRTTNIYHLDKFKEMSEAYRTKLHIRAVSEYSYIHMWCLSTEQDVTGITGLPEGAQIEIGTYK